MPSVSVVDASKPIGAVVVVVGAYSGPKGVRLAEGAEPIDAALAGELLTAYRSAGGSGHLDEVIKIPTLGQAEFPLIVVAGLGEQEAASAAYHQRRGRAVAVAVRALPAPARVRVCLVDPAADEADGAQLVSAIALGAMLGGYRYTDYKSRTGNRGRAAGAISIAVSQPTPPIRAGLRRALDFARAITDTRDLVNMPPNDLYPDSFATQLTHLAEGLPVTVEVLDEAALAREGYAGLLAVGGGSVRAPRLVRLHYRPVRPRARVALVGEGTTFNSGGLNLKTTQLTWAKADMAGAAAAATAVFAAARRKLPIEVIVTLPMAENLPSGTAFRPSDVVTLRGGRTVEVSDTESSGRLTIAEAIGRAVEDAPDYLIEASTLTAAQRVALGPKVIAAMGEATFRDQVVAAGATVGESVWAMPLPTELRATLDSGVADLTSAGPDRWGAMLVGGAFLADFIAADLSWVHLDITGPAWNATGPYGYTPKGATGAGVATIIATLESIAIS